MSADNKQLFSFLSVEFFVIMPTLHCLEYQYHHAAIILVHNGAKIQRPEKT